MAWDMVKMSCTEESASCFWLICHSVRHSPVPKQTHATAKSKQLHDSTLVIMEWRIRSAKYVNSQWTAVHFGRFVSSRLNNIQYCETQVNISWEESGHLIRRPGSHCRQWHSGVFLLGLCWEVGAPRRGEMNSSPVATTTRWPRLTHSPLTLTMTDESWLRSGLQLCYLSKSLIGLDLMVMKVVLLEVSSNRGIIFVSASACAIGGSS